MAKPKARVRPVKVHVPSAELQTTIARGIGFRAKCDCGAPFPKRRTYAEAREDKNAHRRDAHGNPSAA